MTRDEAFAVLKELDDVGVKTTLEPKPDTLDGPGEGFQLKTNIDSLTGERISTLGKIARTRGVEITGEYGNLYLR